MTHHIDQLLTQHTYKRLNIERRSLVLVLLLTSITTALAQSSLGVDSAPQTVEQRTLEPGKPIERELTGEARHSYRIALTSGNYLLVMAHQRGVDLLLTLRGPDSRVLSEMDGLRRKSGTEEMSWEATVTGFYSLEVIGKGQSSESGLYDLSIQKTATATPQDLARVTAERLYMEAIRIESEARGAEFERAVQKYGEALQYWKEAGARKWEGQTLHNLALAYRNLKQFEKAGDYFERALLITREIKDREREGFALQNLGLVQNDLGHFEEGRQFFEKALPIWREIKNRESEAVTLNSLGIAHWRLRQHEIALEYYRQALLVRQETKNRNGEAQAINNMGLVYSSMGQYEKALSHYQRALPIWRETGNKIGQGQVLNNLGVVYRNLSQNEKALEFYEQSLAIKREIKDRDGEGQTLNNLGEVSSSLLQYEKAREFYLQSLTILREVRNRPFEGTALSNLCSITQQLGQIDKAREYCEQALTIARELKNRHAEGQSLNNLGEVYRSLNQYEKARDHYELALVIMRESRDKLFEAIAHTNLGGIYLYLLQEEKAKVHLEQSLAIRREIRDRDGEAQTLLGLSSIERKRANFPEALKKIDSALAIKESLRTSYSNQDLRSTYYATAQPYYEYYIDLLMYLHKQTPSAGYEAAALQANERSRSRSLVELLTEAGVDIREGIDRQLITTERSLQQQLNLKARLQLKLLSGPHTREDASALASQIDELTTQYQQVVGQIRQTSPRYATLTQPSALGLKDIQKMLDGDTLLLEYFLGERRSYLWLVSPTAVTTYELPAREEIEKVARDVYESLSTSNPTAEHRNVAYTLSQMLLGPVAAELGKKRLLIVSEGFLQYLPFGALPIPELAIDKNRVSNRTKIGNRNVPLVVEHEIISLPSASLLAALRHDSNRSTRAPKMLAALADPVFDPNDPRVRRRSASDMITPQLPPELERSARDSGGLTFVRLRASRSEAETIVALARGQNLKALDFDASRATVLREGLDQYQIVHFATHGLLNSLHPELSGLVLSLVDENGSPQDGFLRAHEVYNLKLRADLVVLSACQTALGKEIRGEGLIGLTRGFMYAGAPRVVASLWRVPSKATAELMKHFYHGMFVRKLRPAAALRFAQTEILKVPKWNEPYYWAAFVIQGDWR